MSGDKDRYLPPERAPFLPSALAAAAARPLAPAPRRWRAEAPHLAAVFLIAFALYAHTAARFVVLEDDALFIGNLHFWGVGHPPGYPAHALLGGIFYRLVPFGSPAFKAHLFSGFAAALACAALYAVVCQLIAGRVFAHLAALAYASSKTLWSQAVIAEAYALNAFFFFAALALAIAFAAAPRRRPLFFALAAVGGCGLANHYPLFGLASLGIVALLAVPLARAKLIATAGGALAVAASAPFYLWMVWRSRGDAVYNFYGPIDSLEKFWFYLSRGGYGGVDQQAGADWSDKLDLARGLLDETLWQFTPAGFLLAAVGFAAMAISRHNWLWLALSVSFVGGSFGLLLALNFRADYLAHAALAVYPTLSYGVMAIWVAFGAARVVDAIPSRQWRRAIAVALAAGVVGSSLLAHWGDNNRRADRFAHDLAAVKLHSVEKNAILFLHDDLDLPIGHLHYVEGERPDLDVYHAGGLAYANRLFSPLTPQYPSPGDPTAPSQAAHLRQFILENRRPVYYPQTQREKFAIPGIGADAVGLYDRARRSEGSGRVILRDDFKSWIAVNIDDPLVLRNRWSRFQRYETIATLLLGAQLAERQDGDLDGEWRRLLRAGREQNGKARTLTNLVKLDAMSEEELAAEAAWVDGFDPDDEPEMDRFGRSRVYLLRARLAELLDGADSPMYERSLARALEEDGRRENPAIRWLMDFYAARTARQCDYLGLVERYYPDIERMPPAVLAQLREVRKTAFCP